MELLEVLLIEMKKLRKISQVMVSTVADLDCSGWILTGHVNSDTFASVLESF